MVTCHEHPELKDERLRTKRKKRHKIVPKLPETLLAKRKQAVERRYVRLVKISIQHKSENTMRIIAKRAEK